MTDLGAILGAGAGRRQVRLLFSCAGRRVELIQAFIRAARALHLRPFIHIADIDNMVAAAGVADRVHEVPPVSDSAYVTALRRLVRREKIDFLVPLIDPELAPIAKARDLFLADGCVALVSSPEVIQQCQDKLQTAGFLRENGIDTPETWLPPEVLRRRRHSFPYFLKPREGSASKGNYVIRSREDLNIFTRRVPDAILQEFVPGIEHTIDVYTGYDGVPRCAVPRQRIEVRGGEVTRARTVRQEGVMATGMRVAEALGACRGAITIQVIVTPEGRVRVIEINPRFAGGVPLSIQAGADFPRWLLMEWMGRVPRIRPGQFRDGLTMLRYHQSFFRTV